MPTSVYSGAALSSAGRPWLGYASNGVALTLVLALLAYVSLFNLRFWSPPGGWVNFGFSFIGFSVVLLAPYVVGLVAVWTRRRMVVGASIATNVVFASAYLALGIYFVGFAPSAAGSAFVMAALCILNVAQGLAFRLPASGSVA